VLTARPEDLKLIQVSYEDDPTMRVQFNWLISAAHGTKSTAAVYGELDPGCRLGTHVDAAEEVLLVLDGTVELTVGDERCQLAAGGIAVAPAMVPHGFRNVGMEKVRYIGFFPSATVSSVFDRPLLPIQQQVVGTPNWMQALAAPSHHEAEGAPLPQG
jgi:quercetin dioxygenase-like cupin family protein